MFAAQVFETIAGRLSERVREVELFLGTSSSFEQWWTWEAFAACREAGWQVLPHPSYGEVGLLGSREKADLLVVDPASDRRALVELAIIHDWTTNRWIADLNHDTAILSRALTPGVTPVQIILAASLSSPVEVNRQWKQWLDMTSIWPRPTELTHDLPIGESGRVTLRAWVVTPEA